MAFDSIKRLFKFGSKSMDSKEDEERVHQIDDEIDSLEKDIQESLDYANIRRAEHESEISTTPDFSKSGGMAKADKIRSG